jgi:tRNA (guanine-N7-)-methyltransferase
MVGVFLLKVGMDRVVGLDFVCPMETLSPRQIYENERLQRVAALRRHLCESLKLSEGSLTWEIGSGHGDFLNAYAQSFPSEFCLGIDLISKRLRKSEKKARRFNVSNVAFMKAEATELLEAFPSDLAIAKVFILYPDPWPKKKHWKHRLIQFKFLTDLAVKMKPNGRLYFKTDDAAYFEWTTTLLAQHSDWRLTGEDVMPVNLKTFFEKLKGEGRAIVAECISQK